MTSTPNERGPTVNTKTAVPKPKPIQEDNFLTIPKPKPIQEDDFLTIPEIAFLSRHPRTGEPLKRASIEQTRVRYRDPVDGETEEEAKERQAKALPEPDGYLGSVPYWRLTRLLVWMDSQDRPYDLIAWRVKRESGGFRRHQDLI